jgi:hypothetical protein
VARLITRLESALCSDISASAVLVVEVLGGDAQPADEVGERVGAALVGPGKGADGFVDLRVVAGLLWRGPAGLVEGGEGALVVAVQEVSAGKVDPVMANSLPGRRPRQREFLGACDGLSAVQHFHSQTD